MSTYNDCGICLDVLIDVNSIYFSKWADNKNCKCKTLYHQKCLIKWEKYKTYKQCPICKIGIKKNTNNNIDRFLTYMCNIIDNCIYIHISSIPIDNTYYRWFVMIIHIITSFIFTIFIFIPCLILRIVIKN